MFDNLTVVSHPLVQHKLTLMREKDTSTASFRQTPQIAQLQESIDAMAVELERITEAQRFQSKLMAGKAEEPARLPR